MLEYRIAEAEEQLKTALAGYASDAEGLIAAQAALYMAQKRVDQLYLRWEKLETKIT